MMEKSRCSQEQINGEEIGKLSEKEFRVMILKMIQNLKNRMEKIEEIKSKQTEMNNKVTKIRNTLEGINIRGRSTNK